MPALVAVGGEMQVMYSPSESWVGVGTAGPGDFSQLKSVGGQVSFQYCGGATLLNLMRLETVGSIMRIHHNSDMEGLELSSLDYVGGQLLIHDNAVLASLDLSSLEWLNIKEYNW